MLSHKLFLFLFFLLVIAGFCVYQIYFVQKPEEIVPSFPSGDTSPVATNFPEHQKIPVAPPDYEGSIAKGSEQESAPSGASPSSTSETLEQEASGSRSSTAEAKPKVPSAPSEFIIMHSGSITEIGSDFLAFEEPSAEQGQKKLKAQITADTEIRLVTVPRTVEAEDGKVLFQVSKIKVSELEIGDQILVLGMVKSARDTVFRAIRIDKSDYR
ncbi:MAG: hypothetical protein PHW01_01565 [Patescibacteria group bacterium]|nr:hypothetical protein [Patescibacteria group bacterium]